MNTRCVLEMCTKMNTKYVLEMYTKIEYRMCTEKNEYCK